MEQVASFCVFFRGSGSDSLRRGIRSVRFPEQLIPLSAEGAGDNSNDCANQECGNDSTYTYTSGTV